METKLFNTFGYSTLLSLDFGKSTGSGFLFYSDGIVYLVTAKHVLFNAEDAIRFDSLLITNQTPQGKSSDANIIEIQAAESIIKYSKIDDLAIIKIGQVEKANYEGLKYEEGIKVHQSGNFAIYSVDSALTRSLEEIVIANDVYLMGFPTSLFFQGIKNFDISKPLLRKGIVAGVNLDDNSFIIDCPAYYGNSGAPVIELCEDGVLRVIGLISRYVPFVVEWRNSREAVVNTEYLNSGYSICVSMNSIFKLIQE